MTQAPQTMPARAVYIGTCLDPAIYSVGNAGRTNGFDDPESVEHLALWFNPDGEEFCYYVDQEDLSFDPYEITVREYVERITPGGNLELGRYLKYEIRPEGSINVLFEFQSFTFRDGLVEPPVQRSAEDHRLSLEKYYGDISKVNRYH